jgi:hypothetical protein
LHPLDCLHALMMVGAAVLFRHCLGSQVAAS